MFKHSAFALLLSMGLIINCSYSHSATSSRKSNSNDNIFNLLLGLYKMNPLKGSPVFQTFSNNLLMGMGRASKNPMVLNVDSGESVKVNEQVKMNLNEIEKTIHIRDNKPDKYEKPAYELDDVGIENFKADLIIDDKILSKEELKRTLDNHYKEDFSSLFDHIGSKENDNDIPVTKLLPVNDTILRYSQVSNENDAVFGLNDTKSKTVNDIDTASTVNDIDTAKVRDRNPEDILKDNLVEGLEDVIVF